MNEIVNFIKLKHATALKDAIVASQEGATEDAEEAYCCLFGILLNDNTFNGYPEEKILAAMDEAISEGVEDF